jgi:hypothetical protein
MRKAQLKHQNVGYSQRDLTAGENKIFLRVLGGRDLSMSLN